MWVQRSWPGLAGATGEQMRTVGARFNLDKRYRMQQTPVPGKDELNFSHCASDSSFHVGGKSKNELQREHKKKLLCETCSNKDRPAHKHTQICVDTGLCHQVSVFISLSFFSPFV